MPPHQDRRQPAGRVGQHPPPLGLQGRPLGVRASPPPFQPYQRQRQEHVRGNTGSRGGVEGTRRDRGASGRQGRGRGGEEQRGENPFGSDERRGVQGVVAEEGKHLSGRRLPRRLRLTFPSSKIKIFSYFKCN